MTNKITVIYAIFQEKPYRNKGNHSSSISMENISYGIMSSLFISSMLKVLLITQEWNIK